MWSSRIQTLQSQAKHHLNPFNHPRLLTALFNLYPPYVGAGVRVESMDFARHHIRVTMRLHKLNQNIVGTQFGGSLYTMTDPFMMILLMQALGSDYVVWDKSATIDFVKAGTTDVAVDFALNQCEIATIIDLARDGKPVFREYTVQVMDTQGELVATVKKTLYIRLRAFSKSKHQTLRI